MGTHRADGVSGATGYLEVEKAFNVAGFVFSAGQCERKEVVRRRVAKDF